MVEYEEYLDLIAKYSELYNLAYKYSQNKIGWREFASGMNIARTKLQQLELEFPR